MWSGQNSILSEILCMSSLPASMKRIGSKTSEERWRHRFPHYLSKGAFCCHGNQSFNPICPKTLCSLSPTQVMLHIKFDQDWPTGFRDIQVWKCGQRRTTTTVHWHTISSPCEPLAQVSLKTVPLQTVFTLNKHGAAFFFLFIYFARETYIYHIRWAFANNSIFLH